MTMEKQPYLESFSTPGGSQNQTPKDLIFSTSFSVSSRFWGRGGVESLQGSPPLRANALAPSSESTN